MRMRVYAHRRMLAARFTSPLRTIWPTPGPGFVVVPELASVHIPRRLEHRWQAIRFAAYTWAYHHYGI